MEASVGVRRLVSGARLRLPAGLAVGVFAVAVAGAVGVADGDFVAPAEGTLYVQCVGGSGGASSQFGIGTSPDNFKSLFSDVPHRCPSPEVRIGHVGEGERIVFGLRTTWGDRVEWAFSNRGDRPSTVAFKDGRNALGRGGAVARQTASNTWILHLDDAASYAVDDDNDDVLIQIRFEIDGSGQGRP